MGDDYLYEFASNNPTSAPNANGLLTLIRKDWKYTSEVTVTNGILDPEKGEAIQIITIPSKNIHLVNLHLDYIQRASQAKMVKDKCNELLGAIHSMTVMAGDLNAETEECDKFDWIGYEDAFRESIEGARIPSYYPDPKHGLRNTAIDHVFYDPNQVTLIQHGKAWDALDRSLEDSLKLFGNGKYFRPSAAELSDPLVYPVRSTYGVKAIQSDFWNLTEVVGSGAGGIALNFDWSTHQWNQKFAPCTGSDIQYEGQCFTSPRDDYAKAVTDQNLTITAILISSPPWSRKQNVNCTIALKSFCAPDNSADFGRWAGFLAWRFNGANGHGRITEFVIMNEIMSGQTLLTKLAKQVAPRQWAVAMHSYPPNLKHADFSRHDFPKITFGNLNVMVGWLMKTFPNVPSAWKVYLTENGINSLEPFSSEQKQSDQLCNAFRSIVSTPNVDLFIYHRLKDNKGEGELHLGLVTEKGQYKKAWYLWAEANRFDHGKAACGFEDLPFVILKRCVNTTSHHHLTTTRQPPSGYKIEQQWNIYREERPGTRLIFECYLQRTGRNFPSTRQHCEDQENHGPLGYIFIQQHNNTVPVYRCQKNGDYLMSGDQKCEGFNNEGLLGYAYRR
ncbi:unnamed protein product [Didymodactylos carnosus]|uniref:DUF5722 domain-containing protein n=1 Tax=Didymodactylos carnosus TaxID=1234261 RepID=A0A814IL00_9BILA|nr:unnamed protein product [Didymodactylos carnosus]CAF1025350.1 unnamed protein product [Didymodactylos carnosus]CAF3742407.1 unnamed protein product [Didymodactylos carnosus]CAF3796551.1 unnamed protein product [Didymodactylos carnosus]